jgi:hypothetical protein
MKTVLLYPLVKKCKRKNLSFLKGFFHKILFSLQSEFEAQFCTTCCFITCDDLAVRESLGDIIIFWSRGISLVWHDELSDDRIVFVSGYSEVDMTSPTLVESWIDRRDRVFSFLICEDVSS